MIIDFDAIEEAVVPQFKGGDGNTLTRLFNDGQNKIMRSRLDVGCSIGYHTHETSSEQIFILSGEARFVYSGEEEIVKAGQCHYRPKGHSHGMFNNSTSQPLLFFAVVPEQ